MLKKSIGGVAILMAALFGGLIPNAASAAGTAAYARYFTADCTGGVYGAAYASFLPGKSDIMGARDGCPDGHSGVTRYKIGSSATIHTLWAHAGSGSSVTTTITASAGTKIQIQACTGEYGTKKILGCTAWGAKGSVGAAG